MKLFSVLFLASLSAFSFAQEDLITRHQALCQGHADCRINIIPQKQTDISGSCSGKLMDIYQCEVSFLRLEKSKPNLKIVCTDQEGKTIMDQTIETDALNYKVSAISRGFTGEESLQIDPKDYTLFSNTNLIVLLSKENDVMTGEMMMNMKDELLSFTEVSCH